MNTRIVCTTETRGRLDHYGRRGESYDTILNKLLDTTKEKRFRKKYKNENTRYDEAIVFPVLKNNEGK